MKYYLILVFLSVSMVCFAQKAEYVLNETKNGRLTLDITIPNESADWIQKQEEYCPAGIAKVFCVNNYFQNNIDLTINNQTVDFQIETSVSNASVLQINFSAIGEFKNISAVDFQITAFVEQFPEWKNHVILNLDKKTEKFFTKAETTLHIEE